METKALTRLTRKEKFQATISYHSSGEVIYWDFGQQGKLREDTIKEAGKSDRRYNRIRDNRRVDKIAPAGYKDWALLEMKIPSVTIEIGKGLRFRKTNFLKYGRKIKISGRIFFVLCRRMRVLKHPQKEDKIFLFFFVVCREDASLSSPCGLFVV